MNEEKKKKRQKNTSNFENGDNLKQTKEEIEIAKYLRSVLPPKEGKLAQTVVSIFDGREAVRVLLESKWASLCHLGDSNSRQLLLSNRHYAVELLRRMMEKNFFHRAQKVRKQRKQLKVERDVASKKTDETKPPPPSSSSSTSKESKKKISAINSKKKARVKLQVHESQTFNPTEDNTVDNDDVYVWIYEPFSAWKFLLGGLVLLVILGFCLFPIWPAELRSVAYYGSIGCMSLLAVLVCLVVLRAALFAAVWTLTLGRHNLWLLPNLTADCGVIDSFKPLYEYKYRKSRVKKVKVAEEKGECGDNSKSIVIDNNGDLSVDDDNVNVDNEEEEEKGESMEKQKVE